MAEHPRVGDVRVGDVVRITWPGAVPGVRGVRTGWEDAYVIAKVKNISTVPGSAQHPNATVTADGRLIRRRVEAEVLDRLGPWTNKGINYDPDDASLAVEILRPPPPFTDVADADAWLERLGEAHGQNTQ